MTHDNYIHGLEDMTGNMIDDSAGEPSPAIDKAREKIRKPPLRHSDDAKPSSVMSGRGARGGSMADKPNTGQASVPCTSCAVDGPVGCSCKCGGWHDDTAVAGAAYDLLEACEAIVASRRPAVLISIAYAQMVAAIAKARRRTCPRCLGNKNTWSKTRGYRKCTECKGEGTTP